MSGSNYEKWYANAYVPLSYNANNLNRSTKKAANYMNTILMENKHNFKTKNTHKLWTNEKQKASEKCSGNF